MGPQNLNNYYFNKLDARLDYSSYHDFFLAADERNYNEEVIYSPYIIIVWGSGLTLPVQEVHGNQIFTVMNITKITLY